jgi:hypothetical protein
LTGTFSTGAAFHRRVRDGRKGAMQAVIIRSYRFVRTHDSGLKYSVERRTPVLTANESRQAIVSGRVLIVLSASLGLASLAGAIFAAMHVFAI